MARMGKLRINTGGPHPNFGPGQTIRLSCAECETDHDGITRAELAALRAAGWTQIQRIQSFRQSVRIYDDPGEAPPGYSPLEWFTHLGLCPDCSGNEGGA